MANVGFSYSKVCGKRDLEVGYRGTQEEKEEEDTGCCERLFGCGSDWRESYTSLISFLWSLVLGPATGWFATVDLTEYQSFGFRSIGTGFLFLTTMLTFARTSSRLLFCRLWLLMGFVWFAYAWWKCNTSVFGEDIQNFQTLTMISSILWGTIVFLPLFFTDPAWPCCTPRRQ